MREGLRSSSLRKGGKVDSGPVSGDLDGEKVLDLNIKENPDVVLGGEEGKFCYEVSKNSGKSNGSLCGDGSRGMEVELEGEKSNVSERKEVEVGLANHESNVDGTLQDFSVVTIHGGEEKIDDCCGISGGTVDVGGERKETGEEGLNCTIGAADQLLLSNSQAVEHVDKDMSLEVVKEKNVQSNNEIDDKASCLHGMEVCGSDYEHGVSDSGGVIEGDEKVGGIEVSACKFDEEDKGESLKMEAEEGEVRVVGKVLRSRVVLANVRGEVAGSGQSKFSELKRKRGTDGPGEGVVTVKEESEKSAVESERVRKRGRPKRSIDLSEEEVVQVNKVHVAPEPQGEGMNKKSVKTRKKKGTRGRPKKYVDHPEEEVLQLKSVPFISEDEDEELSNKTVKSPKQKGKRGRPKKFIDSREGKVGQTNKFQAVSEVEDDDLNHKSVKSSKKKGKRGRPRKQLDCPDGEVDCVVSDEARDASRKSVGNSEPKRKRGRPRKSDACPGEEVIQMKKVSFHELDDEFEDENEQLSNKSVKKSKKKRKRGRPKKEDGTVALKATFHDKGKVKNGRKMKVSLAAAPVRRTRLNSDPDKMHKAPTNGVPSMKGHLSDGEISADGPGMKVVHTSSKGQEKPLAKNNLPKKRKNVEKVGSASGEKNLIRNQIVNMLLAAGWTVEYRPRQGREYNDAVYVNREGKTHWSVTKAYFTLKQEFEEGKLVSETAKSNFCFTPIPEEILSKLFRVVSKIRSDKNKKKKHGEGHSGMKRKPSIRSGSQNKRRCALVVRRSKNSESDGTIAHSGRHSILAWMIDSGTVPLNGKVHYMNRRKTRVMLEGSITRDGIHCNCCKEVISVLEFEKHAGSKLCEPYENMYLESGTSLLQCQLDSWKKQEETGRSGFHNVRVDGDDPNDDTCGICGDGGDLVCCDGCPSTFHHDCLDVEEVPSGEWHCVYCSCKFCGGVNEAASESDDDCEPLSSPLVSCSLCEEKYHQSCIDDEDVCIESRQPTFCGKNCEQIFARLQSLVGAKRDLGDGFSSTLLQRSDVEADTSTLQPQKILSNSKLAVALSIMDECFLPIVDHRSGINLIRHIVYSCGSNFKRLNFRSYFTIVLERGDEVISAASIRIRGKQLAEMPFIGTRNVYRRQGMCRRLLNAIELALVSLDVENLVIPAIPELMQTWTSVFGFEPLEESIKEEIRSMSLLVFPHTDMLQKPLSDHQQRVQKSIPTTGEDIKCVESGNAEYVDCGADKSEVDNNGSLNGKFDLNSEAPNLSVSSPDEVHPGNKVEEQQKPDLNLMVESVCEDDNDAVNPNSPGLTHVEGQLTLDNGNQDTTGSHPVSSSPKEKTLNFDLNLIEENVSEFNKLPSDLVGH